MELSYLPLSKNSVLIVFWTFLRPTPGLPRQCPTQAKDVAALYGKIVQEATDFEVVD